MIKNQAFELCIHKERLCVKCITPENKIIFQEFTLPKEICIMFSENFTYLNIKEGKVVGMKRLKK